MAPNDPAWTFQQIAQWLGYLLMALLSGLGIRLWGQLDQVRQNFVSRSDLRTELDKLATDRKAEILEQSRERRSMHRDNQSLTREVLAEVKEMRCRNDDANREIKDDLGDTNLKLERLTVKIEELEKKNHDER